MGSKNLPEDKNTLKIILISSYYGFQFKFYVLTTPTQYCIATSIAMVANFAGELPQQWRPMNLSNLLCHCTRGVYCPIIDNGNSTVHRLNSKIL